MIAALISFNHDILLICLRVFGVHLHFVGKENEAPGQPGPHSGLAYSKGSINARFII